MGKAEPFVILDLIYVFEATGDFNGKISKDLETIWGPDPNPSEENGSFPHCFQKITGFISFP